MSDAPLRTAVLISGSGTNLQAIIDATQAGQLPIELCAVLSDQPDAQGLKRADQAGIPVAAIDYGAFANRPDAERALHERLAALEPELIVLAGFMRILPDDLVEAFEGRMLNIHPSLLPKYRGLHTFRRVLEAGDKVHGSTVHFVVPELDAGPSIVQYRLPVRANDTETTLKKRVQRGEYLIYPRAIDWFARGRLKLEDGLAWLDGKRLDTPVIVEENDS